MYVHGYSEGKNVLTIRIRREEGKDEEGRKERGKAVVGSSLMVEQAGCIY